MPSAAAGNHIPTRSAVSTAGANGKIDKRRAKY